MTMSSSFESPAADYTRSELRLSDILVSQPLTTKIVKAQGEELISRGIFDGDLVLINSALTPAHDDIVAGTINGEDFIAIIDFQNHSLQTPGRPAVLINEISDLVITGVVYSSVRIHKETSRSF